jgi:UDP-N-acetylmuramoylalanine--D-glutamate ligase
MSVVRNMKILQKHTQYTVVGMGLTGLSCARFFAAKGVNFRVVDSRINPELKTVFETEFPDIEKHYGEFTDSLFNKNDILVVSPGMPLSNPSIKYALSIGATLTSDIEIFLNEVNTRIIAITGSNGKSTVTTLVGEILKAEELRVCVAGNIGIPVLEQCLIADQFDVFVLELSSFQLERLATMRADAVTILNVTEDHMDRYNSFNDYLKAKQRIFSNSEHVVFHRDDTLTHPLDKKVKSLSYGFSEPANDEFGVVVENNIEWIVFGKKKIFITQNLKIKGRHNILNAMAAMALCKCLNISWQAMTTALSEFKGLQHRCEWVQEIKGISFYNDSKATNVGAAVAAINGFESSAKRLFLIAGGLDKDSDFSSMASVIQKKVEHVFLIGRDANKLEQAIGKDLCTHCIDIYVAVNDAFHAASFGDVVLLAPACASFDMFKNYEDRGDTFVKAVMGLHK